MKKLIIFKNDLEEGVQPGQVCYVKFLDKEKNCAIFYNPLIAPKYFKQYIKENKIEEAYEVTDDSVLNAFQDKIYTFTCENGVYHAQKGFSATKKLILLVDPGMEMGLSLQKYSYELDDNKIIISEYKKSKNNGYCYVADEGEVSPHIKNAFIEVTQIVPNILYVGEHEINAIDNKKGIAKVKKSSAKGKKQNKSN